MPVMTTRHLLAITVIFWPLLDGDSADLRAEPGEPTTPKRIITIAPNAAEIICALGACGHLVAVSKFCVHPPELESRPRIGGLFDPDLERIVSLRPDLVVLRGKNETLENLCREREIRIYRDETQTIEGVAKCIRDLGRRLNLVDSAAKLTKQFRARLDRIKERNADRPKPRVLLTAARRPDRLADLLTFGSDTFPDEMLSIAGGVNIFHHLDMRYPQVSAESIIAQRPDVIIELMPEVDLTERLKSRLLDQWKALGPIPAVQNQRVYFITDDHCLIPSPRYVDIIEKVSRLLHPEPDRDP